MNNYRYITLLSDDSYIFGVILLQESLKKVNTQYPLEVLVTSNVSKPVLNILEQLDLTYYVTDAIEKPEFVNYNKHIQPRFTKTWALCLTKLKIFGMTQFDKLIFLDADIMVLKNLDHLFECPHMTSALDGEYFNLWPDDPHFNSGILVITPNEEEYKQLIDYVTNFSFDAWNRMQCIADQELLNLCYRSWPEEKECHLNKYYDVFAPYIQEDQIEDIDANCYFIHFIGRKPWRAFIKDPKDTYTEKYYNDASKIIQDKVNTLDWDAAKDQVIITVYGICKNEITNVERYINCFSRANYLCILDTGSTDGTWEYLQDAQKTHPNLIIDQKIIEPWRYDTARNLSLELVPKETTMYFMADLDEDIKEDNWPFYVRGNWNPLFLRGSYTYNRAIDPATGVVTQQFIEYRIHNNSWHYKGVVHEQLFDVADSRTFYSDECITVPIVVWHYATHPNRIEYIELCERGVEEEPLNWLMHLQLAAEYEVHEQYENAINEYRKIIAECNNLAPVEFARCYASLGRSLSFISKTEEGLSVLKKGITLYPDVGDLYFFAAEIEYNAEHFIEAIHYAEEGLKNHKESYWCTIIGKDSYFPYMLLGICYHKLGQSVLGLGYAALAKNKNNNEDTNNLYNAIIYDINRG